MIYLISTSPNSQVKNLRVSKIEYLSFQISLKDFDNLIITSKNSLFALLKNHIFIDEQILQNLKIFAIGQKSAEFFLKLGFKNVYISKSSNAKDFANEILLQLKGKKNLYLRAKLCAFDMENFFKQNELNYKVVLAYESLFLKLDIKLQPKENAILIFTSPSNVKNFIKNFSWNESYKAICLGKTTAKALQNYTKPFICQKQDIKSCIEFAKLIY